MSKDYDRGSGTETDVTGTVARIPAENFPWLIFFYSEQTLHPELVSVR